MSACSPNHRKNSFAALQKVQYSYEDIESLKFVAINRLLGWEIVNGFIELVKSGLETDGH